MTILIILGVILLIVAVVLFFLQRSRQGRLRQITGAETSTARDLIALAASVAKELGEAGRFAQVAEVKGVIKCDAPLTSELAGQPCVYYSSEVSREYEERYYEYDAESKRNVQKTRRGSERVAGNTRSIAFGVDDGTGRVRVEPAAASVDGEQVVDRFEQEQASGVMSIGSFSIDLGPLRISPSSGRTTLGYRFRERVLPLDRQVYVLGEAADAAGELCIRKPAQSGRAFIISLKSEEELVRSAASAVRWLRVGAIASGAAGLVLVVVGLVR